jgi:hypothetical protein
MLQSKARSETSATVLLPVPYLEQPDGSTCLPTSLLMVLHYMGRADLTTQTVFELHKRCQYDRYNLPAIVADYGLYAFPSWLEHAWTPETIENEIRAGRPVILGVDVSRPGHFVVAVGFTPDGNVIIHDPDWKANGYFAGGTNIVSSWDALKWRNGIMIRSEPFPEPVRKISATIVDTTAPRTLASGQTTTALITVRNNGSVPWPVDTVLRPVEAYGPQWKAADRISLFGTGDAGPEHTTAPISEKPVIAPGEVALFRVLLRAPQVDRNTTFRENYNLFCPTDGWFSQYWQSGPSNREIFLRLAVVPPTPAAAVQPRPGRFLTRQPVAGWRIKNPVTARNFEQTPFEIPPSPALPSGPFEALLPQQSGDIPSTATYAVYTSHSGQINHTAAYVGDPFGRDYSVSSWVWCDYRPLKGAKPPGPDVTRVGLFARDSGQHQFGTKTELESGDALLMAYDSDDGRLRVGSMARGGVDDWRPRRQASFLRESGWNHFRIDCRGTSVTYFLNGSELHTQDLTTTRASGIRDYKLGPLFEQGDAGVFIETLSTPQGLDPSMHRRGVYFADFRLVEFQP